VDDKAKIGILKKINSAAQGLFHPGEILRI